MRELIGFVLGLLIGLTIVGQLAHAHEDAEWIMKDTRKIGHGWCCGPQDCAVAEMDLEYEAVDGGYIVEGEFMSDRDLPGPEGGSKMWRRVYPSEDFQTWICRRKDGKPKCFFPAEAF